MTGRDDYMYFDEEQGRVLVFVPIVEVPMGRLPMRMRYRIESETVLGTKLWDSENWQSHVCRLEGDALYLVYDGGWHEWTRVTPEEAPVWLREGVALAYSRLWLNPNVRHPEAEFTAQLRSMSVVALQKLQRSLECNFPREAWEHALVIAELASRDGFEN